MTWRVTAATALAVTLALIAATPAPAITPSEPLGHAGRWITDAKGRVVVLHGFNTVPGVESQTLRQIGMGPDNARWLARRGFNTIRLGISYARIEPEPGVFDDHYMAGAAKVQRQLARKGVFSLIDMHQDQLHPRYGTGGALHSRGFPEWFLRDDGLPNTRAGYPTGYLTNPALNRAYDNIWADFDVGDGATVREHFARGWRRVARHFRENRGVLGYDFFNEPWPGTPASTCANPVGCPPGGFDQTLLTDFNRKLVAAIRGADRHHLIFYEPNLLFDFGAQTQVGDPGDRRAGFSFHGYCLANALGAAEPTPEQCEVGEELVLDNAEAHVARTGDALLMTEVGFDPAAARRWMELTDRKMVSWQWWDYYGDHFDWVRPKLPILIRPYPRLVAGTPLSWSFDAEAKTFELGYSTRRADGEGARRARIAPGKRFPAGSKTEVFIPKLHFPGGYRALAAGARIVSPANARRLVLASCRRAETITLRVAKGAGSSASCPR